MLVHPQYATLAGKGLQRGDFTHTKMQERLLMQNMEKPLLGYLALTRDYLLDNAR